MSNKYPPPNVTNFYSMLLFSDFRLYVINLLRFMNFSAVVYNNLLGLKISFRSLAAITGTTINCSLKSILVNFDIYFYSIIYKIICFNLIFLFLLFHVVLN